MANATNSSLRDIADAFFLCGRLPRPASQQADARSFDPALLETSLIYKGGNCIKKPEINLN
jgi:hypothetical protein